MIQSFRVELLVYNPIRPAPHPRMPGAADLDSFTVLKLSHLCDQLHRLVARLRLRQRPIARLEIAVKFLSTSAGSSSVLTSTLFPAVETLLNPFRRLCQINKPQVLAIMIRESQNCETNIHLPGRMDPRARSYYDKYLKLWSRDLSSSQASFRFINLLEVYWRLANLISNIRDHCSAEPKFWEFTELLATAMIARDDGKLERLKQVRDRVAALWFTYQDDREVFEFRITQSILKLSGV